MGKSNGKNSSSQWKHLSPETHELKKCKGPKRCKFKNSDTPHFNMKDSLQRKRAENLEQNAQQTIHGDGSAIGSGKSKSGKKQNKKSSSENSLAVKSNQDDLDEDIVSLFSMTKRYGVAELTVSEENNEDIAGKMDSVHEHVDRLGISVHLRLHKNSSLIHTGYLAENGYRCLLDDCSRDRKRELGDDTVYSRLSILSQKAVRRSP